MIALTARRMLSLATLAAAWGCSGSSPTPSQPVKFNIAANTTTRLSSGGPLQIASFRLVAGPAALGSGQEYGCKDCQGGGTSESSPAPQLITVPSDGSPVALRTEEVSAGRYGSAEIELARPDAAVLAAVPGWPTDASAEVSGTYNGTAFTLYLPLRGAFREALNPPVDVAAGASAPATVNITITLPVGSWFSANGVDLDPTNAAQRAQILAKAQASLLPEEAGGGEGREG